MEITVETLMPKLIPFVRLINTDKAVADAVRVPRGYGHLRGPSYSGWTNKEAIKSVIRSGMETWRGLDWNRPEFDELFKDD